MNLAEWIRKQMASLKEENAIMDLEHDEHRNRHDITKAKLPGHDGGHGDSSTSGEHGCDQSGPLPTTEGHESEPE